ncbi:thioredoxin-like protein [Pelagophyceae sp. CCMP2097]|nr:thioredoxin-like protein [Pelagophyceae sp. CCMP2097]
MVQTVSTKAEFDAVIKGNNLVVVDFTASWCGPCQQIKPYFEELAAKNTAVTFIKVDVDENAATAQACGISAMPTFQYYKGGAKVDENKGANKGHLDAKVAALQA